MRTVRSTALPFLVSALALAVSAQSQAQLEEVIVTAQKREASLQDTPVAVSAFSQADLRRQLIDRPLDLQLNVPNMQMTKGNFTTADIAIRGIGNLAVGTAGDSGTGIHFNGMYLNSPRVFEAEFFDLERVEVLRGPQGTLYGRNTTAGVLNMITAKPEDEFSGNIYVEGGNYNHRRIRGHVNIPLTENVSQRFSGFWFERDGFVDNQFPGDAGGDIDGRDMYGVRSSTRWAGERTDINFVVNYLEEDSTRMRGSNAACVRDPEGILGCLPTGLADEVTHSGATINGFLTGALEGATGIPFPDDDYLNSVNPSDPRDQFFDVRPRYAVEDLVSTLEIVHEFDTMTLTSLTGYHDTSFEGVSDFDYTQASEVWPVTQIPAFGALPNPVFCVNPVNGFCESGGVAVDRGPDGVVNVDRLYTSDRSTTEGDEWNQELRLQSDFDGPWNFLLGAFYLRYEGETHYYVYSSSLNLFGLFSGVPVEQHLFDNDTSDFVLDTWAVFGEAYYDMTDKLRLTLGLRYSDETKEARQRTIYLNFLSDPNSENEGYDDFEWSDSATTGRFNVQYAMSDDLMTYVQLSRSFKSGGFNPIAEDSLLVQQDPDAAFFDPEFINAFEVGVKSQLMDGRLQANATYFYYDYEDLQVSKIVQQTAINENFNAKIQGLEGEFIFAPTASWLFTASLSWLDTEVSDGESVDPADPNGSQFLGDGRSPTDGVVSLPNNNVYLGADCPDAAPIPELGGLPGCAGIPDQLSGNQLPRAPEFSANIGARYTYLMDGGAALSAGVNYYWQDAYEARIFNAPKDEIEAWDVWNATLRYTSASDVWYAELWGRNLTDDDFVTGQYQQDQNIGLPTNQFLLEPRTYGVTLNYVF